MIREAIVSAGLVLALAAFGSGDGDYELVIWGQDSPICAKSEKTCTEARIAIREGRMIGVPRDAVTECRPHPGCFSPTSNTIKGQNR